MVGGILEKSIVKNLCIDELIAQFSREFQVIKSFLISKSLLNSKQFKNVCKFCVRGTFQAKYIPKSGKVNNFFGLPPPIPRGKCRFFDLGKKLRLNEPPLALTLKYFAVFFQIN